MHLPRYQWRDVSFCAQAAGRLARTLALPRPVASLMAGRGLAAPDEARVFLDPRLASLSDPLVMTDMTAAVERLIGAITASDLIVVFADFDADGVTSAAVLAGVLQRLGAKVGVFHPERISEGYGLTGPAIERCLSRFPETGLLVTVDCGIRSHGEVDILRRRGIAVIVTDHHQPGDTLPDAHAVINPCRDNCPRTSGLAGVGVVFKLCHALVKTLRRQQFDRAGDIDLRRWLDLVAVGTVADVVPLTGENRILVNAGLRRLNSRPSPGLQALIARAGLSSRRIAGKDLGFVLGPRLNAAGRMASAATASELLMTSDLDLARKNAAILEQLNASRRGVEREMVQSALSQLGAFDPAREGAAIVASAGWHPGAVGIVASRLAERVNRPAAVIVLHQDGSGRGSIRSAAGVNLLPALEQCADVIERAGGHRAAAGFTLKPGALEPFRLGFSRACLGQIAVLDDKPELAIDDWLTPEDIDSALLDALSRLEPFGDGHPPPCWALSGVMASRVRSMGRGNAHLSMDLSQGDGSTLQAVGFNFGHGAIPKGPLDVAGSLQRDRWQGRDRLRMNLRDLRPHAGDNG